MRIKCRVKHRTRLISIETKRKWDRWPNQNSLCEEKQLDQPLITILFSLYSFRLAVFLRSSCVCACVCLDFCLFEHWRKKKPRSCARSSSPFPNIISRESSGAKSQTPNRRWLIVTRWKWWTAELCCEKIWCGWVASHFRAICFDATVTARLFPPLSFPFFILEQLCCKLTQHKHKGKIDG